MLSCLISLPTHLLQHQKMKKALCLCLSCMHALRGCHNLPAAFWLIQTVLTLSASSCWSDAPSILADHVDPWLDPTVPREQRVEDLLGRLTLEEKVSQLSTDSAGISRLGIRPMNWWAGQSPVIVAQAAVKFKTEPGDARLQVGMLLVYNLVNALQQQRTRTSQYVVGMHHRATAMT